MRRRRAAPASARSGTRASSTRSGTPIIAASDSDRDLSAVAAALRHVDNGDAARRVVYTESHDEVANGHARVPEEIWPGNAGSWFSRKRSTLGASLVFCAPGIPMIFQGQEFLEDKYFQDDAPLDWAKLTTYAGIHLLYRDLIRLRRNWFNQTRGLTRPAGERASRQQRGQGARAASVGRRRARRRRGGRRELRQPRVHELHARVPASRTVAGAIQQRLAGLRRRLRQPARLRHAGERRSARQHAVPGGRRRGSVLRAHPVAGLHRSVRLQADVRRPG